MSEQKPVAEIVRNSACQITMRCPDGSPFDMSQFVGSMLYTAPPAQPAAHADYPCRTDGRCQYAIESGAEGMGHCPKGKCVMAQPAQAQPARLSDALIRSCVEAAGPRDESTLKMAVEWYGRLAHAIAAAVVPPGFVVVPEEPTEAMCKAGDDCQDADPSMDDSPSYYTWRAMIAAAKATK